MVEKVKLLMVSKFPDKVEKETVQGLRVEIQDVEVITVLPVNEERIMEEPLIDEIVAVLTRIVE